MIKVLPVNNGVQIIQLDSPSTRNALTIEMRQHISAFFKKAEVDDDVNCVIITGGDKIFAAGADIKSMLEYGPADVMREAVEQYWFPVKNFTKPLIAAVNGYALGGGCELVMHTDIIIAGSSAQFGQPEVCLGIMPGSGGTQRLPRAIGKFKAMKLLLTGQLFSSQEACDLGLVTDVVDDDHVLDAALELATTIAAQPKIAVRKIKEVVFAGLDVPLETGLLMERQALHLLFDTDDQKEGMRSFVEKRKPKYKGS